ncbi:uncharacterized protein A4U43_C04F4100 [Asparagus officinalis]|uniref:RING-type E3 ubiquitin transferase n=2 Tax=Asparagus officinalis TaxID=4686 RepID=A0A5P1F331_ASPOF|nr:uncharacterized protein A4U43_C04F4100 [Asparagus officinalis]
MHADKWRTSGCKSSSKLNLMVKEKVKSENFQSSASNMFQVQKENELTLKRLAEDAFQPQVDDHHKNSQEPELNNMNDTKFLKSEIRKTGTVSRNSDLNSSLLSPGTSTFGGFEDMDQDSFFSRIPKDFVCPITGQLFQDPVTLESGQTYERAAIKEWFDQGNKTCPVTNRTLEFAGLPVEPRQYGIYREEAVDSIVLALDLCLSDTKYIPNCRKALLMLGGYFSFSGETLTETWLLKQAGFCDDFGTTSISYDEDVDEIILEEENEEESREKEEWLKNVALVLLCSGKGSFLETLSKCLDSQNTELLKVCLTTIAWMSHALASLSLSDLQLSVFLSLIPRMKEILEKSEQIEHRILASLSLLNFSKISECRILLVSFAEEIHNPLKHLVEMTSIAKHLYATVFG